MWALTGCCGRKVCEDQIPEAEIAGAFQQSCIQGKLEHPNKARGAEEGFCLGLLLCCHRFPQESELKPLLSPPQIRRK